MIRFDYSSLPRISTMGPNDHLIGVLDIIVDEIYIHNNFLDKFIFKIYNNIKKHLY